MSCQTCKPEGTLQDGAITEKVFEMANEITRRLLDTWEVSEMLGCSRRQVWRLKDSGFMPQPIRLGGRSVKWQRGILEQWVHDGCPDVRRTGWTPGR